MKKPKNGVKKSILKTKSLKKHRRLQYAAENMSLALKAIKEDGLLIRQAAAQHQVPESTIRAKLKGLYADKKPGPARTLTDDEELQLVNWISRRCEIGYPVDKKQLLESVQHICTSLKRPNKFTNNLPGQSWYIGFRERHPKIVSRVPEKVCKNRTKASEADIRNWFVEIEKECKEMKAEIKSITPDRIFNTDETGKKINYRQLCIYCEFILLI